MEWDKLLIYNAIPSVLLVIIGFLVVQYINAINKRIDDLSNTTTYRFKEIMERLFGLTDKMSDVLDVMLQKFSQWEDKIKTILAQVDVSGSHKKIDIESELKTISNETKGTIVGLRNELKDVTSNLYVLEKKLFKNKHEKEEAFKSRVNDITLKIGKLKVEISKINETLLNTVSRNSDRIEQMYRILRAMNVELKYHTKQIETLNNTKGNIKFFEKG